MAFIHIALVLTHELVVYTYIYIYIYMCVYVCVCLLCAYFSSVLCTGMDGSCCKHLKIVKNSGKKKIKISFLMTSAQA